MTEDGRGIDVSQYDSIITRITESFSGRLGVLYIKADEVVFLVKEAPKPLLGPTLTPYYPTNQSIQSIQPIWGYTDWIAY